MNIEKYIEENFQLDNLISKNSNDFEDIKNYYENAKKDAIYFYNRINGYIKKDSTLLEVGGGIHLLTSYLGQYYDITSVEPGSYADSYADNIDVLRSQILKKNNSNIHTTTLENFRTTKKYDFIFSMNVLEHTKDIKMHIESCVKLLKNENSILLIECPNYSFPFEPHFYEFFIPFFPKFTFQSLKKNKLIKKYGENKYYNILDNLNFACNFNNIKKITPVKFNNPIESIFNRIKHDQSFKQRILSNFIIKLAYNIIVFLKLEKLLVNIFPIKLSPYLIMEIKK